MIAHDESATYVDAIRVVGPLAFAIGALGVGFGYLARTAGLSSMASITMSAITFAGSPQFAAVSIFGRGGTMLAAVGAAAMLASRFTAMSATAAPSLDGPLWRRLLLAQLVVDETWAVAYTGAAGFDTRRLISAGTLLYIVHVGATAIGATLGGLIGNVEALGVDAMSPALFVVLLRSRLRDRASRMAAALAAGIALIATPFTPPGVPISLALGTVLLIALSSRRILSSRSRRDQFK